MRKIFSKLFGPDHEGQYYEYFEGYCDSSEEKPLELIADGSNLVETNTGKWYFYNEKGQYWGPFSAIGEEISPVTSATLSGSTVVIPSAVASYLESAVVTIDSEQGGSGDPTPENIRLYPSYEGCSIIREASNNTKEYSASWKDIAGKVCKGTYDATNGVLTVNKVKTIIDGSYEIEVNYERDASKNTWYFIIPASSWHDKGGLIPKNYDVGVSETFTWNENPFANDLPYIHRPFIVTIAGRHFDHWSFRIPKNAIAAPSNDSELSALIKDWLNENPISVIYEIAPDETYNVDPINIALLSGENTIHADAGDIEVSFKSV